MASSEEFTSEAKRQTSCHSIRFASAWQVANMAGQDWRKSSSVQPGKSEKLALRRESAGFAGEGGTTDGVGAVLATGAGTVAGIGNDTEDF